MNYSQVRNDAGLYREYIVKNFGGMLTFGGLSQTYWTARKHCQRLARLTKQTFEQVLGDIKNDYEMMEG